MSTNYRQRITHCERCHVTCRITVNMDTGKIVSVLLPEKCQKKGYCEEKFIRGVFDRRFGERLLKI